MKPLRVKVAPSLLVWIGFYMVFNLYLAFSFYKSGSDMEAIFCFGVANLLLIPLLRIGTVEMTDEYIRSKLPMACFEIAWDEIERIEASPSDMFMVLHAEDKKLVMLGRTFWAGPEKHAALELFGRQLEVCELTIERTNIAHWQISQGTRVKEF